MLKKIAIIFRREIMSIIHAPFSAVVGACFVGISGYTFSSYLTTYNQVSFYPVLLRYMANLLLVTVPFLTMGLLAGEAENGSRFLLLSSPVSEWDIVLGKWIAVFSTVMFLIFLTLPFPLILMTVGTPDSGQILAGYIGISLLSALFCAAGLFGSSLTKSSTIGAVTGFALILLLGIIDQAGNFTGELAGSFFKRLSYIGVCNEIFGGVIYGYHIVYFVSFTFFFLFATQRVLSSNRWR